MFVNAEENILETKSNGEIQQKSNENYKELEVVEINDDEINTTGETLFPKSPNKKSKVWILIITVILLISGIIGGYFWSFKSGDKNSDKEEINDSDFNEDLEEKNNEYYSIKFEEPVSLSVANLYKIDKIKVKKGLDLVLPISAEKSGYIFKGWNYDGQSITKLNNINKDMVINAMWEKEYPTVNYNFDEIEECSIEEYSDEDCNSRQNLFSSLFKGLKINYFDSNIHIKIDMYYVDRANITINDKKTIQPTRNFHGVRVFKFNEYYLILFTNAGDQYSNEEVIILDKGGNVIGQIVPTVFDYNSSSRVSFFKENNQIVFENSIYGGLSPMGTIDVRRIDTYQLENNTLTLIDTNFDNNMIFIYANNFPSKFKVENIKGSYRCLSNECKEFDANEEELLLYDDGYYAYNYITNEKILITEKNNNGILSHLKGKYIDFYAEDVHYIYEKTEDNYQLKWSSESYEFIQFTNEYAVVIDEGKLKILNFENEPIFEFDYLPNAYVFKGDTPYYASSENIIINGYDFENNEEITYYYNLNTKETQIKKG